MSESNDPAATHLQGIITCIQFVIDMEASIAGYEKELATITELLRGELAAAYDHPSCNLYRETCERIATMRVPLSNARIAVKALINAAPPEVRAIIDVMTQTLNDLTPPVST